MAGADQLLGWKSKGDAARSFRILCSPSWDDASLRDSNRTAYGESGLPRIKNQPDSVQPHQLTAWAVDDRRGQFLLTSGQLHLADLDRFELVGGGGGTDGVPDRFSRSALQFDDPAAIDRSATVRQHDAIHPGHLDVQTPHRRLARRLPTLDGVPVVTIEHVFDVLPFPSRPTRGELDRFVAHRNPDRGVSDAVGHLIEPAYKLGSQSIDDLGVRLQQVDLLAGIVFQIEQTPSASSRLHVRTDLAKQLPPVVADAPPPVFAGEITVPSMVDVPMVRFGVARFQQPDQAH